MAENEPITPEKQLLKLIENPKGKSLQVEAAKREGKKWFSLSALRGKFSFWKSFSFQNLNFLVRAAGSSLGLRQINLALRLAILFLFLYLGYSVATMGTELKRASNLILPDIKAMSAPASGAIEALKSLSYYTEKLAARDIFKLVKLEEKPKFAAPQKVTPESPVKHLSLVGISWSSDPVAMIEDTVAKRTYFVARGQPAGAGVRVVTVFKDKVILSHEGLEYELK
jgi:hypothetical protein